jgi:hypothetical protein
VLRAQIERSIAQGQALMEEPFADDGRWGGWATKLADLIERALGPGRWPEQFHDAGNMFGFAVVDAGYMSEAQQLEQSRHGRNQSMGAQIGVTQEVLTAIDDELERRGVTPAETGLLPERFAFVATPALREIAQRDYEELRGTRTTFVKSRLVLAGAVIEAAVMDALVKKGSTLDELDARRFADLINAAEKAGVIKPRTAAAARPVKDYRNFVHPTVEIRDGAIRAVDANAAVSLMQLVIEDLR